jgi:hypothetical protein
MEWILFYKSRSAVGLLLFKVFIARGWSGVGGRIDLNRLEGKRLCLRISTGENVSGVILGWEWRAFDRRDLVEGALVG